jgi:hypothetical protein
MIDELIATNDPHVQVEQQRIVLETLTIVIQELGFHWVQLPVCGDCSESCHRFLTRRHAGLLVLLLGIAGWKAEERQVPSATYYEIIVCAPQRRMTDDTRVKRPRFRRFQRRDRRS